ncbi:MAG TPA: 3-oxoacyl-[acyl-carrier-protein] reductase [Planctomycetes bacterium]|nr:3-oxoacyl-[acyl-carrier-protein] reductase [Planctomycetota bacterium]
MDLGLTGKLALVTGASRGIGRAIATELAREGASVACVATSKERVQDTVDACRALGGAAEGFGCDVSDHAAVTAMAAEVQELMGPIDILVNNAGVTRDQLILRMKEEDWDAVLAVNLKGAFNTCKAFARTLMKRGGARIINIASVVGLTGNAGQANYAASKGGLLAFTKSLAKELSGRQVTVNAVAPGFIETDMTEGFQGEARDAMARAIPLGRFGAPEDVARVVALLAGTPGAYVTGQCLPVDGGMAL